ncbi:MAG: carbon storage regulator CsrA [Verrucomicrobia bacterium]|nr:carbon storage regulator CsrA [Verrucomicrobiota bacterium]
MLILSRKVNEGIIIGDSIHIKVTRIDGDAVKIGIEAPKEIPIFRTEIYQNGHSGNFTSGGVKSASSVPAANSGESARRRKIADQLT